MSLPASKYFTEKELRGAAALFNPPPDISGSEWANEKRILSKEDSAEPGKYTTDRAPFQKEPLDEITNPYNETIVMMWSSQIGKTLIATNALGYYIDYDPSSIMYVIETLAKAESFSKQRLDPMIRDNPWMPIERKVKNSGNTILEKSFPGGYLSIVGANSPAGMTSKPIRILILDEIDNYPPSAGGMGSPVDLAIQRTETFDNRKIIKISSPGLVGFSKIFPAYQETDQRTYNVPCMRCGYPQQLLWKQLKFPDRIPEGCYYECINCQSKLEEKDKFHMIQNGAWVKGFPDRINKPGFHLSRLYSVFSPWSKMVAEYISADKAKKTGDEGPIQVFINSSRAELYDPYTAPTSVSELIKRVEHYMDEKKPILPRKVILLTAGVDCQEDRLEIVVDGWGLEEESWIIEYKIIRGNPSHPGIWNELDEYLKKRFLHPMNLSLGITAAGVDTGDNTDMAYKFCKGKSFRKIFALKGSGTPGRPVAPRKPSKNNKYGVPLFIIGVNAAKDNIYNKLAITKPGPGFMHFDGQFCDDEFFEQLTAEKKVRTKWGYGYELLPGRRNEVLDTKVYSLAALKIANMNLRDVNNIMIKSAEKVKAGESIRPPRPNPSFRKRSFALR